MVEVLEIPWCIGQLSADLTSSVVWSSVGLLSFKRYKQKVFREFDDKELDLKLTYEQVTPFANEQIELEYSKEVQFIGKEEEFNAEAFDLFEEENPEVEEETSFLDEFRDANISEEVVEKSIVGVSDEPKDFEIEDLLSSDDDSFGSPVVAPCVVERSNPVGKEPKPRAQVTKLKVVEEVKPKNREVVYYNGMSLRQFLRENPRSSMDIVEKYFSRKEIMKDIQLGKVIKRGKKLFI